MSDVTQERETTLRTLLRRYEQGEFIRNPEGSPLQRLLRELVNVMLVLEEEA